MQAKKERRDQNNHEMPKPKSEALQKLIQEKNEEKQRKEEKLKAKELEEKQKNHFRIPKKKREPLTVDTENLINSLFEDSGVQSGDSSPDVSGKAQSESSRVSGSDKCEEDTSKSVSKSDKHDSNRSSVSNSEKSHSSGSREKFRNHSSDNHIGSNHRKHSGDKKDYSKHSDYKSNHHRHSGGDKTSSSSSSRHTTSGSGLDGRSSSHHKSSSSHHKSSSSSSSSRQDKEKSSQSPTGDKHSKHTSSDQLKKYDKGKSMESSHKRQHTESSSKSSKSHSSSSSKSSSSSHGAKPSSSSNHDRSSPVSSLKDSTTVSSNDPLKSSDKQPITLTKHHLNPLVERQVVPTQLTEREKILAKLQAIKERTLAAIHSENKGKRLKGEKTSRKSKGRSDGLDEKAKSVEIVKDISSSDEDEVNNSIPSALDIMMTEHEAKTEKERISRMAKQAWERAQKKDTDSAVDLKSSKKRKSSHKSKTRDEPKRLKLHKDSNQSRDRAHSLSPCSDLETKKPPVKVKKNIVRHSGASAPPPMDFQAILAMAEQKQKEPAKPAGLIPRKKKKEEDLRPLTQEEKERKERTKSKDYQNWLKYGGKRPGQKDEISDDEEEAETLPPTSSSSSSKISISSFTSSKTSKNLSGNDKAGFSERKRQQGLRPPVSSSSNKSANIVINENVLVCGSAGDSNDEHSPTLHDKKYENPFDKIMSQVHKKRVAGSDKKATQRIVDEDSEEEDSDMDDFIDDGDNGELDYSREIKNIFGYDKKKFKLEDEDDLSDMETNFTSMMKEEQRSARLGMQEDLEDMRKEQEALRRKAMLKKQMKRGR